MNVGVNCVDRMFNEGFTESSPWILDFNLTWNSDYTPPKGLGLCNLLITGLFWPKQQQEKESKAKQK